MDFTEKCLSLPVLAVLFLVGFIYYTVVFLVIEQWLSIGSAAGLFNALLFSALTVMALFSYALAIFRDPGRVPSSYMPDTEDSHVPLHEVKRKGGDLRYCQKCGHYKPPRAHHCRVCKRCVLRMILLVGYAIDALWVGEVRPNAVRAPQVNSSMPTSALLKVLCAIILTPLTVGLIVLLGWHIYLLLRNKTTIEYHEGVRAHWLAGKAGHIYRHPYDIGLFPNIVMVLGPNLVTWPCPTFVRHLGSGLEFPTTYHDKASSSDEQLS